MPLALVVSLSLVQLHLSGVHLSEFPVLCLEPGSTLSAFYVDRNPVPVVYHYDIVQISPQF